MDIERKVVVITGGASGIGKAVGKLMVNKGADKVFLADLNEKLLNKTAEEIGAIPIVCDVSNEESVKALVNEVTLQDQSNRYIHVKRWNLCRR